MTVRELIAALQRFDGDTTVVVEDIYRSTWELSTRLRTDKAKYGEFREDGDPVVVIPLAGQ
jgi:hypothetical protein